jgi:hypothetical protein
VSLSAPPVSSALKSKSQRRLHVPPACLRLALLLHSHNCIITQVFTFLEFLKVTNIFVLISLLLCKGIPEGGYFIKKLGYLVHSSGGWRAWCQHQFNSGEASRKMASQWQECSVKGRAHISRQEAKERDWGPTVPSKSIPSIGWAPSTRPHFLESSTSPPNTTTLGTKEHTWTFGDEHM